MKELQVAYIITSTEEEKKRNNHNIEEEQEKKNRLSYCNVVSFVTNNHSAAISKSSFVTISI